jgi:hypothetical protein
MNKISRNIRNNEKRIRCTRVVSRCRGFLIPPLHRLTKHSLTRLAHLIYIISFENHIRKEQPFTEIEPS